MWKIDHLNQHFILRDFISLNFFMVFINKTIAINFYKMYFKYIL
ncbi:hypothetical protein ABFY81_12125 [Acinetobacter sp. WA-87]